MSGDQCKKGFSGLSSLASDIRDLDNPIRPEVKVDNKPETLEQPTESEWESKSSQSDSRVSSIYIIGIIGFIFVIWLASHFAQNNNTTSSLQANNNAQSNQQSLVQIVNQNDTSPAQTNNNVLSHPKSPVQTSNNQQYADPTYIKPQVGTNNILSEPEIRWCIREGIRIEAMRSIIDTNEAVDAFNSIVSDSNSRCGNFRYRHSALSRAKSDVETFRSQIEADAILEAKNLGNSSQSLPLSISTPKIDESRIPNVQDTKEVQQLLIELGYKLGSADGNYGNRTVVAVKAFQRDNGMTQDGSINQSLLSTLRTIRDMKFKTKANKPTASVISSTSNRLFDTSSKDSITASEKTKIKRYCAAITGTLGDEYNCISHELNTLKQSGGMPDLSGITQSERTKIKQYCRAITGSPGDEYNCLRSELGQLRTSGY